MMYTNSTTICMICPNCHVALMYPDPLILNGWIRCCFCGYCKEEKKKTRYCMTDKNSIYVTMDDYLGTNGPIGNLSSELQGNANILIPKINELLASFGGKRNVTSGLRSMEHHLEIYRIKNEQRIAKGLAPVKVPLSSAHLSAQAVDLEDSDRVLTNWCLLNLTILERCGLYMEDPSSAVSWVHLQIRPTKNRVFIP